MMKCVKLTGVKKLELAEMEKPVSVDGSVVFKVESAGICGSDIHNWDNGQPEGLVLGHEFAGTVVDPGYRIDLKEGDKITGLPISPCGVCITPLLAPDCLQTCNSSYVIAGFFSSIFPPNFTLLIHHLFQQLALPQHFDLLEVQLVV